MLSNFDYTYSVQRDIHVLEGTQKACDSVVVREKLEIMVEHSPGGFQ